MTCPARYVGLPCSLSGVGYSAVAAPLGAASITLQTGHGAFFPAVDAGQFFFAEVTDGCGGCCETVRVTGRTGDVLAIVRDAPTCDCLSANSRVRYVSCSRDAILAIAAEVDINAVPPLHWDCETRTLTLECCDSPAIVPGSGLLWDEATHMLTLDMAYIRAHVSGAGGDGGT